MSLLKYAKLLKDIESHTDALDARVALDLAGLALTLRSENSNTAQWLESDFASCKPKLGEVIENQADVRMVYSDDWISTIRDLMDSEDFRIESVGVPSRMVVRAHVSDAVMVDYLPLSGTAWIADSSNNKITLVCSSRTSIPEDELRVGLTNILARHMQASGWHLLRSLSVQIDNSTLLLLDNGDDSNIALYLDLIRSGGTIVGSDSAFVRHTDSQVEICRNPGAVALSMGWARRYQALAELAGRPDRLALPQLRFVGERVWKTPVENFDDLPDQLLVRPSELASLFDAPAPASDGTVDFLVVTAFAQEATVFATVEEDAIRNLVGQNLSTVDFNGTASLRIQIEGSVPISPPDEIGTAICRLPALALNVSANAGDHPTYADTIKQAIENHDSADIAT